MAVEIRCDRCGKKIEKDEFNTLFDGLSTAFFGREKDEIRIPILCKKCRKDFVKAYNKFLEDFLKSKR